MIGYYWSAYKVLWYFYSMFCTLLYFTYMGMMLVSLTPNYPLASILSASSYTMLNLFSGFIIPQPVSVCGLLFLVTCMLSVYIIMKLIFIVLQIKQIPKWWLWLYYLTPTSWTLNSMLSSQYGDIEIEIAVFGETKTVAAFLRDYFGFHHDRLPIVGIIMILYPIVFASIFAYSIGRLNFQRR